MTIKRFKDCRTCGKQEPRKWTEDASYQCDACKARPADEQLTHEQRMDRMITSLVNRPQAKVVQAPRSMAQKSAASATALRSDPTRRALRNQGDSLDPLNPASLTSPLNPAYDDWDKSSHRQPVEHDTWGAPRYASSTCDDDSSRHTSHSSHDSSSYDSGSSDSGSSSSGSCD